MENWKDIQGYEGLYQISNLGNIKGIQRIVKHSTVGVTRNVPEKLISTFLTKGYKRVNLWKDNKDKKHPVHVLIAQAFIPNPQNKPCVNHIDGKPSNNNINNLEWVTHSENSQHAANMGLISTGEKCNLTKLTEKQVLEIRALKGKMFQHEIAKRYGITQSGVSTIHTNKNWKQL
jgi:hypothetical protein